MIRAGAPPLTSKPLCMSPTVPFNLSVHLSPLKEKGQVLISKLRFVAASYNLGIYIPVSPGYEFRGLPTVQNIGVNQELSQPLWPHPPSMLSPQSSTPTCLAFAHPAASAPLASSQLFALPGIPAFSPRTNLICSF